MARFELQCEWTPAPEGEAFGPERTTWARLVAMLDDTCLTTHFPQGATKEAVAETAVNGPVNGLADWLVENWLYVLWDTHTPFAKATGDLDRVPTLRDAREGRLAEIDYAAFAGWYHRHTLGHGSSDLALPMITFLPEDNLIGLSVAPPDLHLDPTVRFSVPWPKEPVWLPREDVVVVLRALVEETIERGAADPETRAWTEWLRNRFGSVVRESQDDEVRRRVMFGDVVANQWDRISEKLGSGLPALTGILTDSSLVRDAGDLEPVGNAVVRALGASSKGTPRWRKVKAEHGERLLPPYERGYRLAARARRFLGIGARPLADLADVLDGFGVQLHKFQGAPLFRSACVANSDGSVATVYHSVGDDRFSGVAPTRFAIAAALGRLLSEGSSLGGIFGCAHGSQSRWQKTQEANAFAAEFLLPLEALRESDDTGVLADGYGISRTAAERHRINRLGKLS